MASVCDNIMGKIIVPILYEFNKHFSKLLLNSMTLKN
jgi:hypothetical protein